VKEALRPINAIRLYTDEKSMEKGEIIEENNRKVRSEEHTSELSHANISYAVFCLKKKKQ